MSQLSGFPVLVLKKGSRRSRGRNTQHANIMAARIVAEAVKSALGPKGMDKMLVENQGDVTITSDGRTILEKMDIQHPAAKMMVEVAKAQDQEVGDGTTTAVILAGELLKKAEELIKKKVYPMVIIEGYRKAAEKALEVLKEIAIPIEPGDKETIEKVAMTSMASKLVAEHREHLAEIAASAVLQVAEKVGEHQKVDLDTIMVLRRSGESLKDTSLINGIILDKEIVHPNMPKRVEKAKIAILETPLKIEKFEKFNAKINIENLDQVESFLKQEKKTLKEMVEKIVGIGTNVLVCHKGIDDLVKDLLAQKNILTVTHPKKADMEKLLKATGGRLITSLDDMKEKDLGYAELVEERKIPAEDIVKLIFVEGCKNPRSVAILIRGGTKNVVDEANRSLHDALCVSRNVVEKPKILGGGGAPEMEISSALREYAKTLPGREQLVLQCFAEAIEVVPATLSENAGLDPIDKLLELRSRHKKGERWAGIDVFEGNVKDMTKLEVYEPLIVKEQIIMSATEAASMILKTDDIIAARPRPPPPKLPERRGRTGKV